MKKQLLLGSLILSAFIANAQTWGGSGTQNNVAYRIGHIGIGTSNNLLFPITTPYHKLEVFSTDGGGIGVTQTGSGDATFSLHHAVGSSEYGWSMNCIPTGYFTLQNVLRGTPDLFVKGETGNIGI